MLPRRTPDHLPRLRVGIFPSFIANSANKLAATASHHRPLRILSVAPSFSFNPIPSECIPSSSWYYGFVI